MDIEEIKKEAQNGDIKAMGILGENYLHGNMGLDKDYDELKLWLFRQHK